MRGSLRRNRFVGDARWSLGIFTTRAAASLAFVVVVSRSLESAAYGLLAATSILTSLAAVVVTGGISHAMTMAAARSDGNAGRILAAGLRSAGASVVPVAGCYLMLASVVLQIPLWPALLLFGADVVLSGAAELVASVLLGLQRFGEASTVWMFAASTRAVAALLVVLSGTSSLLGVTAAAFFAGLLSIPVTVAAMRRVRRSPGADVKASVVTRRGAVFTYGNLVSRANNDFDKLYLSFKLGESPEVGTYALGYRLVEFATTPLVALSTAAYPRLFKAGESGVSDARALARRLTIAYFGTAVSISLLLAAMAAPAEAVFGESYAGLAEVIWWLSPLPILRAANNLLSEPLTGGGQHRIRVALMTASLVVTVIVIVALFDSLGWKVGIVATYASEGMLLVGLATVALVPSWRRALSSQER
jgi:O-antigen/teichoic acid export membrane protein